jgi:hypothetical protein
LFAVAVCVSAADTPTVTVKGYVLDSACAFIVIEKIEEQAAQK